jgi:capsular exopolysaccharide synthesis family protein
MTELRERIDRAESRLEANPDDAQAQAERDAATNQLITFESRADRIAVDAALFGAGVERFTEARPPEDPAQPQPLRNAAVAAVLGLLASSALAWWRAEQTQSADRRQDPAPVVGAPLLAQVPDFKSVGVTGADPARSAPHSPTAESYQFLVSSLEYALADSGGRTVVVTSPGPADGKTLTAFNLAVAAARDGRRVLLCDADERVRGLTALAGTATAPGITDLADDEMPLEGCVADVPLLAGESLPFVPCGSRPSDPAGFFRTPGFRKALGRVTEGGDLVVLDSPPLLAVADASAIAGQVDGIILVVAKGTPLKTLEEVRERLEFIGTPLLGYVFNRAEARGTSAYSYGYDGYGYGHGHSGDGVPATTAAGDGNPPVAGSPPVPQPPGEAKAGARRSGRVLRRSRRG